MTTTDSGSRGPLEIAKFMWGWVLLGVGVPAAAGWPLLLWALTVLSETGLALSSELAMFLFGPILGIGLGTWMVSSAASRPRGEWSTPQRGQMTRFTWGWLSAALGVPVTAIFLLMWRLGFGELSSVLLGPALFGAALATGLAAGVLGCASSLSSRFGHRTRLGEWPVGLAMGLLTTFATGTAWLYGCVVLLLMCWGPVAPEARRLGSLVLGSLFAAPLVGAVIVVVGWFRRRSKSSEIRPRLEQEGN